MNRRNFMKFLTFASAATAYASLPNPFGPGSSGLFAAPGVSSGKTLVVLFQRGGNDGINTVVPVGDYTNYSALRPNIQIPSATCLALNGNSYFKLHPSLKNMQAHYNAGRLAIFPAVHWSGAPRSHFDAQKTLELGKTSLQGYIPSAAVGWLNAYLTNLSGAGQLRGIGLEDTLIESLKGPTPVSVYSDLSRLAGSLSDDDADYLAAQQDVIFEDVPASPTKLETRTFGMGQTFIKDLETLKSADITGYVPAVSYPKDNTAGTQLKQIAALVKEGVGLEIATLTTGGWDSHAGQGATVGMQPTSLTALDEALNAFMNDLAAWNSAHQVVVLVMTEFGRTAKENGTGGTDHGKAACWMALGPRVNGNVYGRASVAVDGGPVAAPVVGGNAGWPGLAAGNLTEGRYLMHNIDYRDILAELLTSHLGASATADIPTILPGYTFDTAKKLGFVKTT